MVPVPSASAAAARAAVETLVEGVYICSDWYKNRTTHRILLWTGEAYVLSHDWDGYRIAALRKLDLQARERIEAAFAEQRFFELPRRLHNDHMQDGSDYDLRAASKERAHRHYNYMTPYPRGEFLFDLCKNAFGSMTLKKASEGQRVKDLRELKRKTESLAEGDRRRKLMTQWLLEMENKSAADRLPDPE
jgi:hypothetical protein